MNQSTYTPLQVRKNVYKILFQWVVKIIYLRIHTLGTLLTSSNYAMVAEQLQRDCVAATNPSPEDVRFCELVDSCLVYWQQLYNLSSDNTLQKEEPICENDSPSQP